MLELSVNLEPWFRRAALCNRKATHEQFRISGAGVLANRMGKPKTARGDARPTEWFKVPMHAKKRKKALHESAFRKKEFPCA